jgi:hypothetical protein
MLRIHNRYLPEWLHRIANAIFVGCLWCATAAYAWRAGTSDSWWHPPARWAIYITPLIILAMLFVRRSLIRGVAGDDGYDELS